MRMLRFMILAAPVVLWGCVPTYTLVNPGNNVVAKKSMTVQPATAWNRIPVTPGHIPQEESWTKNGPLLDTVAFVGALPEGKALAMQKQKDDRQVPVFKAGMTPDDLVSMVEGSYRVGGVNVFEVTSVQPALFLGQPGIRMDFSYVMGDQLPRKGRCVMGVVNNKFYLMKLEGAASHYFDASAPEFDQMLQTAAAR